MMHILHPSKLEEENKKEVIQNLNIRIGSDVSNLTAAFNIYNELENKKKELLSIVRLYY